jgi:hypothetical protein
MAKKGNCMITYTDGSTYEHEFSKLESQDKIAWGVEIRRPQR